jgi:hypothetical protein
VVSNGCLKGAGIFSSVGFGCFVGTGGIIRPPCKRMKWFLGYWRNTAMALVIESSRVMVVNRGPTNQGPSVRESPSLGMTPRPGHLGAWLLGGRALGNLEAWTPGAKAPRWKGLEVVILR